MQLSREQVNTILKNAPANIDKKKLLDGLILKGYDLEGVDSNKIRQSLQPEKQETFGQDLKSDFLGIGKDIISGSQKRAENIQEIKSKMESGEKGDIPAILETAGQLAGAGADAIGNVFKGAVKMALSPKTEEKVKGLITEYGQKIVEQPEVQKVIQWYEGLPEDKKDALDAVGGFASLATEFIGVGAGKRLAQTGKEALEAGIKKGVGEGVESSIELSSKVKSVLQPVKEVVQDLTPTKEAIRDKAFAKAFKLAPVEDLARIRDLTGNKPAEWADLYGLYRNTPGEMADAIAQFKRKNLSLVDDAITLVPEEFTFADIPELKTTIDFLKKDLSKMKSAPYKQALDRISQIEQKGTFQLIDAQYVKKVFDDIESIYKRTGDVKEKIIAQDMANTITPVRRFIEDRVKEVYPDIDIRSLNNNVRTSTAILDAVVKRSPKGETSNIFQLGDMAVMGVGNQFVPGGGFPALFGKKIIESSPVQLRIAKYISGKTRDITKGMSLDDIKKADDLIREELKSAIDEPTQIKLQEALKETQSKLSQTKRKVSKVSSPNSTTKVKDLKGKGTIPENSQVKNVGKAEDAIAQKLIGLDTSVPTINGKIGLNAMNDTWTRLDELKLKLESKGLTKKEYAEADKLLKSLPKTIFK